MRNSLMIMAMSGLIMLSGCESSQENKQKVNFNDNTSSISYSVPDGWISETPTSSMRKAQFRLPGPEKFADAELAVFNFPGTGGSVEANIERWYKQFLQPDGSPTREHAEKEQIKVNQLEVTVVYTTGTFLKSTSPMMTGPVEEKNNFAMLAAIVDMSSGPWFFKATGPKETIDYWRKDFMGFINTFRKSDS